MRRLTLSAATTTVAVAALLVGLTRTGAEQRGRVSVAATTADLAAIVKVVGGDDVDTFALFRGCMLRRDMLVEADAARRLPGVDAVAWTGFFNESSAIHASIEKLPAATRQRLRQPAWIDVSRDAMRVGIPTSSCEGYVEPQFMHGDPYFWLNPRNGAVIARNLAEGLAALRPERRAAFSANAEAFSAALAEDVARWQQELRALPPLKVFSAQCGWQNFAQLGGPSFITCRRTPGTLEAPESLAEQINAQGVQVVIVDPNTPPTYAEVFRSATRARVVTVPSSIADLPGATAYSALFDNLVKILQAAAAQ